MLIIADAMRLAVCARLRRSREGLGAAGRTPWNSMEPFFPKPSANLLIGRGLVAPLGSANDFNGLNEWRDAGCKIG